MKRIFALLLAALLALLCVGCAVQRPLPGQNPAARDAAPPGEIRAVWLSYYEMSQAAETTRAQFVARYREVFARIKAFGLDVVFVQVRPFADSIYPSEVFPWSAVLTGTQGQDPGYDPLAILLELAQAAGLAIHAWINPFRIAKSTDPAKLAAQHPAQAHIKAKDRWVLEADGQLYWNPALPETHALVYAGARELLQNYPALAGLHIDDYFYPTAAPALDAAEYEAYCAAGGALALGAWRRELVSQFVAGLYRTAKQANPAVVFSISPSANIEKDRDEMFADVERWLREPGYCDWMLPQVYFGFAHYKLPFAEVVQRWSALAEETHTAARLAFGLAAYKCGESDPYAGTGSEEWIDAAD
ncbi:MAG: family 10 glycosylhydrolase, partial [Oscillospiraceae bacterium]|nr:family 10 glycosylhydrolase [Oscillospiraceae bacterium]